MKSPHVIWTHSMIHRQKLASINMSEGLQTAFQAVFRVVNNVWTAHWEEDCSSPHLHEVPTRNNESTHFSNDPAQLPCVLNTGKR